MNAPIDGPSLKASDRYLTPRWVLDLVAAFWPLGIDLDPFHDPKSHVQARARIDVRAGGDANVDPWPGVTAWVNGPYSGRLPQATAKRCAWARVTGHDVLNLCPAAPGSDYWAAHVWPFAAAIAWMGRLAFEAAVDVHDAKGRLVCAAGKALGGNRTEIALVYYGDEPDRFRSVFSRRAAVTLA